MDDIGIVAFLTTRLDEDKRVVDDATARQPLDEWDAVGASGEDDVALSCWKVVGVALAHPTPAARATARYIAHWDPQRMLAEIKAKRRIIELHAGDHECSTFNTSIGEIDNCGWVTGGDCSTMRLLAMVYASHPDYDPAWEEPDA